VTDAQLPWVAKFRQRLGERNDTVTRGSQKSRRLGEIRIGIRDGLTRQQWQTLAMGFSWRREGRSISVRDWIAKLNPGEAAARLLARLLARNSERSFQLTLPSSRAIALFAILLVSLTVWISFNRLSFERKISGNFAVPKTAANTLINADPMTHYQNLLLDGKLLPGSASTGPRLPDILSRARPTLQTVTFAATDKSDAARTALHNKKLNKINISVNTYRIRSRDNFAEIRVRRSSGLGGNTTFVWWTEPSSAKPGIDYVPQTRMTQLLPKGSHLASLFIRIIPNASRKHFAMFYVTIADPSNGTTMGHLARTAILLPPSS
jgi:hypothetical protein